MPKGIFSMAPADFAAAAQTSSPALKPTAESMTMVTRCCILFLFTLLACEQGHPIRRLNFWQCLFGKGGKAGVEFPGYFTHWKATPCSRWYARLRNFPRE